MISFQGPNVSMNSHSYDAILETEKKHKSTIFIAEGCALIFLGGIEVEMTSAF